MTNGGEKLVVGETPVHATVNVATGDYVEFLGDVYYRIAHSDQMRPFFMSLASSSDHWLFIASNGGLTAGRANADSALFPYETEDKIVAHNEVSGGKTILRVARGERVSLWEPFSERYAGLYRCERSIYKNVYGNKLVFEEVNHDLGLTLRVAWRTGDRFGFIRTCRLQNDSDAACHVEVLDGFQNLLPYGATVALQTSFSSLLDAYKRSELEPSSGLGLFALSATLTDRAEPSESLQASVAWQTGLDPAAHLLCRDQMDAFRQGRGLTTESDILGKPGAYLVQATFELPAHEERHWHIVADVNQDRKDVAALVHLLRGDRGALEQALEADIDQGTANLINYVAAADGLQLSAAHLTTAHHFANVLFNIMRGGVFAEGYHVRRDDLLEFIGQRNRVVRQQHAGWLEALPDRMPIGRLYAEAAASGVPDLIRLCYEYLPLTFSRRHGDPSRPWNRFSINMKKPDGSPSMDYQGNWRDIFQNWEPLALSFPHYTAGMIAKFVNATTADGYNPYRVTRAGVEWEVPEPANPWANIGYWSDHQIVYLQKLLEIADQVDPAFLPDHWQQPVFTYTDVPYRLRPYGEMLADWTNTIDFDWEKEEAIEAAVAALGTDGRLMRDASGAVIHVTLVEKLLVLLLAKLANLVPGGGIWMNTQRPEWNDANNALVGKGLSVVTVAYLYRFVSFWLAQLETSEVKTFSINTTVADLLVAVQTALASHQSRLEHGFSGEAQKAVLDELGNAISAYRATVYEAGIPQTQTVLEVPALREFLRLAQGYIEHTLRANRRDDGLYHAYNVLHLEEASIRVEPLYPMLEGQVALLSSGLLTAVEAVDLLRTLRDSDLYRADQHSYILYPNRKLPGFLEKNNVLANQVAGSALISALTAAGDERLLYRDREGTYHFNGRFRNADDVARVLGELEDEPAYADLVAKDSALVLDLFEETFQHRFFTGRSGTFFAYEGLGSIYWHMVSKLLLAAQENYFMAVNGGAENAVVDALAATYFDIRQGLGFNKSPADYGAFPTDPYSHTPFGSGARQPGMTGQVKEEIITRAGELGAGVRRGVVGFRPVLLPDEELLTQPATFTYVDVTGQQQQLPLPAHALAFTFCQTPVVYVRGDGRGITVTYADGRSTSIDSDQLDEATSRSILARDGQVQMIEVGIAKS